jgi:hypothetical protein
VAAESAQAAQPAPPASPRRQSRAVAEPVDAGRRGESLPRPAVEREELEAHVPPARLNDIPATDPSIASDPEPEQPRIELSARPPPHPVPTTDPSAAPGRGPEQPRIELSPRPPPDPVPPDAHWEAQAGPAQPVQPTITIGQVRVEIVEDSRPAPAGARPLTAGSASVIGPLGQAQAARRLIALRRL